jgi:hypothetical protein
LPPKDSCQISEGFRISEPELTSGPERDSWKWTSWPSWKHATFLHDASSPKPWPCGRFLGG